MQHFGGFFIKIPKNFELKCVFLNQPTVNEGAKVDIFHPKTPKMTPQPLIWMGNFAKKSNIFGRKK